MYRYAFNIAQLVKYFIPLSKIPLELNKNTLVEHKNIVKNVLSVSAHLDLL